MLDINLMHITIESTVSKNGYPFITCTGSSELDIMDIYMCVDPCIQLQDAVHALYELKERLYTIPTVHVTR